MFLYPLFLLKKTCRATASDLCYGIILLGNDFDLKISKNVEKIALWMSTTSPKLSDHDS